MHGWPGTAPQRPTPCDTGSDRGLGGATAIPADHWRPPAAAPSHTAAALIPPPALGGGRLPLLGTCTRGVGRGWVGGQAGGGGAVQPGCACPSSAAPLLRVRALPVAVGPCGEQAGRRHWKEGRVTAPSLPAATGPCAPLWPPVNLVASPAHRVGRRLALRRGGGLVLVAEAQGRDMNPTPSYTLAAAPPYRPTAPLTAARPPFPMYCAGARVLSAHPFPCV